MAFYNNYLNFIKKFYNESYLIFNKFTRESVNYSINLLNNSQYDDIIYYYCARGIRYYKGDKTPYHEILLKYDNLFDISNLSIDEIIKYIDSIRLNVNYKLYKNYIEQLYKIYMEKELINVKTKLNSNGRIILGYL
jgi:hypothetical protein